MAPDRGTSIVQSQDAEGQDGATIRAERRRSETARFIAEHANEGQNFTLRGILLGLGVGLIICFSNMYFGLQVSLHFAFA